MVRILVQIVINAAALYVAGWAVDARVPNDVQGLLLVALVFGLLNAFVRPILSVLTCPFYILTLGLFTFVMNGIILWILERWTGMVEWGGNWNLLFAGIIVSLVSFVLNLILGGGRSSR